MCFARFVKQSAERENFSLLGRSLFTFGAVSSKVKPMIILAYDQWSHLTDWVHMELIAVRLDGFPNRTAATSIYTEILGIQDAFLDSGRRI